MSRYAEAHKNTKGPGDARPTAMEIVEDEGLVGKLSSKVFLVTGVSSGIGIETMRALYATGGHVFGTVRNLEKGRKAVEEVKSKTKGGKITLIEMDQDSLTSVRAGAESFLKQSRALNILVNNAGVMATPEGKTKDGFETQFGTNHVSHFLLFQLLKDTLLASSTPDFPSRVVSVSSFGHRSGEPRLNDYNFTEAGSYNSFASYGQSKTANIWFANEIERKYGNQGLHATSLHPGGITTGLQVHVPEMMEMVAKDENVSNYMKNPEQGAATSVYAALSEEWKNKGGKYLSDCVEQPPWSHEEDPMFIGDDGYAAWAYDEKKEKQLWKDTLSMVGLSDDQ